MKIYATQNYDQKIETIDFLFPGGEVGVVIDTSITQFRHPGAQFLIDARLRNSNDIMALHMVVDALQRKAPKCEISLFMPYIPYARQDRVCNPGESLSIKVFADMINRLNFAAVYVCDAHSNVAIACLERVREISQLTIISEFQELKERVLGGGFIISPDQGAYKKTCEISNYFSIPRVTRAEKVRRLQDGAILETIVHHDDFGGADTIIFDDICDGGRTFIELAKALRAKNAGKIALYVTHGIFSKGLEVLWEHIDEIYCTDSFGTPLGYLPTNGKLKILSLNRFICPTKFKYII